MPVELLSLGGANAETSFSSSLSSSSSAAAAAGRIAAARCCASAARYSVMSSDRRHTPWKSTAPPSQSHLNERWVNFNIRAVAAVAAIADVNEDDRALHPRRRAVTGMSCWRSCKWAENGRSE